MVSEAHLPHSSLAAADELARGGRLTEAIEAYTANAGEIPSPAVCLGLARCHEQLGDKGEALRWALATTDSADDFTSWQAAAGIARRTADALRAPKRTARLALLGSYTTSDLATMLWLAALRLEVRLELYESPYAQYRQEILDPASAMYRFAPDFVLLAVHAGELELPLHSESPENDVVREVARWQSLWETLASRSTATMVQHLFAIPPDAPFGHLGTGLPGSRAMTAQAVNARLAASAPDHVAVVDCERLAALVGKRRWFDPRYWHLAKQAVALDSLPLLGRQTAAVIAARLGLGKKCLVLDLDNTIWGGIVGEDGVAGLKLGEGPEGEAFQAFQESVLALKERGIVLAVCSKNTEADAREVFERHPAMRIRLADVAVFIADWRSKPEQVVDVAERLDLGLDALVLVDDNPAEREAVRQFVPEVDVVVLPRDPSAYVGALADYLLFEPASFTPEDARRTEQYRGRQAAIEAAATAGTIEDFYRSLDMTAVVSPFTEDDLPRIAQLVAKTNQFNLTSRRHSASALRAFVDDESCVHLSFRLRDRFGDHGLVAIAIAFHRGETLEIDTWLMSCRVIGRTLEQTVLEELCRNATERRCTALRGFYVPTAKNGLVQDLFARLGFEPVGEAEGGGEWLYELRRSAPPANDFIAVARREEQPLHAGA